MKLLNSDFIKIISALIFIALINIIGYNFVSFDRENINPQNYLLFYYLNIVILSIMINFKSLKVNILGVFFVLLLVNLSYAYGKYIFYFFRSDKSLLYIWYFYILISTMTISKFSKKDFKRLSICLSILIFNIFFVSMIFIDNLFLEFYFYYFVFLISCFPVTFFIVKKSIKLVDKKVNK